MQNNNEKKTQVIDFKGKSIGDALLKKVIGEKFVIERQISSTIFEVTQIINGQINSSSTRLILKLNDNYQMIAYEIKMLNKHKNNYNE